MPGDAVVIAYEAFEALSRPTRSSPSSTRATPRSRPRRSSSSRSCSPSSTRRARRAPSTASSIGRISPGCTRIASTSGHASCRRSPPSPTGRTAASSRTSRSSTSSPRSSRRPASTTRWSGSSRTTTRCASTSSSTGSRSFNFVHRACSKTRASTTTSSTRPPATLMIIGGRPEPRRSSRWTMPRKRTCRSMAQNTGAVQQGACTTFSRTRSLRTTHTKLRDYDFEKPQPSPRERAADATTPRPMEYFEYPGGFTKSGATEGAAQTARIRELRRDAESVRRRTSLGDRHALRRPPSTVEGAAEECLNAKFVVTDRWCPGVQQTVEAAIRTAHSTARTASTGIPDGARLRLRRVAPAGRASMKVQTAVVTGPSDQHEQVHPHREVRAHQGALLLGPRESTERHVEHVDPHGHPGRRWAAR